MNYDFMPSLGHMALVVTLVSLWTDNDVLNTLYGYYLNSESRFVSNWPFSDETWQQIEDEVAAKISYLQLPKTVKLNLRGCVRPIGFRVLKFLELCSDLGIKVERYLVSELCWTSIGTVDAKKTAQCLIKNEDLDVCKRYELACAFCLEKEIPELWNKIPTVRSKAYYSKYVRVLIPNKLALLWAYDMKGELARLATPIATHWLPRRSDISPYQFAFEYSVIKDNRAGAEFFLRKLTPSERNESSVIRARLAYFSDIFCFLLSQLDEDQQLQIHQYYPEFALLFFLDWPYQKLFTKMASNLRRFLSPFDCKYVLGKIVEKVRNGYADYDYQALFRNFWLESSVAHKQGVISWCIIDENPFSRFTRFRLITENVESIALLLRYAIEDMREEGIAYALIHELNSFSNEDLLKLYILCRPIKFVKRDTKKELLENISTHLKGKTS